jgi:hypothetical protein
MMELQKGERPMLERLLDYWFALEVFQPAWPVMEKEDIDLNKSALPWPPKDTNPEERIYYDIYIGRGVAYDLIVWALESICEKKLDKSLLESDKSECCMCALKVDASGKYVAGSFAIASFVWGLGCLVEAKNLRVKLILENLKELQNNFNEKYSERENPFSLEDIKKVFDDVRKKIKVESIESNYLKPSLWAHKNIIKQSKNGSFPTPEASTELMQSFYTEDINLVKKMPGKQVTQYAEALHRKPTTQTLIDTDTIKMQEWLRAEQFPKGTWPSVHSPSLMQQLAINLAIAGQPIFSVNGPPGTGKTTLLKEIVASNIVERAILMANYNMPDDAFRKCKFKTPPNDTSKFFYCPVDDALNAFGMLVASNNNAAVENVSMELPKVISKDRSTYFTNTGNLSETYFSDIATALINESAWGLISARLGRKKNLKELRQRLSPNFGLLKQYYDSSVPNWEAAKRAFQDALKAVEVERERIADVQKMLQRYTFATRQEQDEASKLKKCQSEMDSQLKNQYEQQAALKRLEEELKNHKKHSDMLKDSIFWFKRLFVSLFTNDPIVNKWLTVKRAIGETMIAMINLENELRETTNIAEKAKTKVRDQEQRVQRTQDEINRIASSLDRERIRFGGNFADDGFWQDIHKNDKSQSACPWTYQNYDKLREELFYRALMLQKAFVLNSNRVKQNLRLLFNMWDGIFSKEDHKEDRKNSYGYLLNTLFYVVPVISTTFASVQTFLDDVKPGELGILVVDEAGQATPQSALGAIWRTRKAIVVGDPLQVEPILTTPLELRKRFAEDYDLPTEYRIPELSIQMLAEVNDLPTDYRVPELSVQMLADAQNSYGGERDIGGEKFWLGCPLVVHRRCIEPMFGISNRVAYEDRMFCKTQPPPSDKRFMLEKSTWFDVSGEEVGNKNHTVNNQIDLLESLLIDDIKKTGKLPESLYIITPFTSVEYSIRKRLLESLPKISGSINRETVSKWLGDKDNTGDKKLGTIHTFQGKEADEVILVLGCDRQKGMGAAKWVGQKPNIINVAVSRAKYRLGVIGSYELWHDIDNVKVVCEMLRDAVVKK